MVKMASDTPQKDHSEKEEKNKLSTFIARISKAVYKEGKKDRAIVYALAVFVVLIAVVSAVHLYINSKGGQNTQTVNTTSIPYTSSQIFTTTYTTTDYTTTAEAVTNASEGPQVMTNLITWTDQNGFSQIQWKEITELDVFNVWIDNNGALIYDSNMFQHYGGSGITDEGAVISSAHDNNVKVVLAVGGSDENNQTIENILDNSTFRALVINNIVTQVKAQGYDGVQVDFEGYFNRDQFTAFMQQLSAAMWAQNKNYIIDVEVAGWDRYDFDVPALSPYVTYFDVEFNPSMQDLQSWAQQAGSPSKVSAGYDLTNADNFTNLGENLANDTAAGYGVFFYNAADMNSTVWTDLSNAKSQGN
jgi:hypothetical protein